MKTSRRARVLGFGAALLLPSACNSGPVDAPPGLEFHVAGTLFGPGDTIRMDLSNNTEYELIYNLCLADLERRGARGWPVVQRLPEGAACTTQGLILRPGESAFGLQPVYPFIDSGVYRFRDQIEWPIGDRVEVVSNTFRIAEE